MAKQYLSINSKVSQLVGGHNNLVNKIGDLAQLNTTVDSDLVGAINAILSEGSVDSAAIVGILDSGQYLQVSDLFAGDSGRHIIVRTGAQTITGIKTFTSEPQFTSNARVKRTDNATLRLQATTRRDSSEVLSLVHNASGSTLRWGDSDGVDTFNLIVIPNRSATSPQAGNYQFYSGNNILIGTIDSAAAPLISSTIITRSKGDLRYLLDSETVETANVVNLAITTLKLDDSAVTTAKLDVNAITAPKIASSAVTTAKILDDAVTRAKLANEVQLIIYDSNGVAIKTLYGAGS